jgi:hypothetical protein
MIKQQLTGETWAIGGKPEEILPLHTSLYNWHGIGFDKPATGPESQFDIPTCEPLNLGAPETFLYFIVKKANFLKARTMAMLNASNPLPHLHIKGKDCMPDAKLEAEKQFSGIQDEKFLDYCGVGLVMDICELEIA